MEVLVISNDYSLTAAKIASIAGLSLGTTLNHLKRMHGKGLVLRLGSGKHNKQTHIWEWSKK